MASKKPKITKREFLLARAFLKGLHGNVQNTYLLLAVVAWLRAMNKAHDPYWKSLARYSAASAGQRLANKLLSKASKGQYKNEYKAVVTRLRGKFSKSNAMASQAADFILGMENTHWDKNHYGYVAHKDGHYIKVKDYDDSGVVWHNVWVPETPAKNPLWDAYAALTNSPNIPNSWWVTTTKQTVTQTKVIPPRPHQPRSLMHVLPRPEYIQPYAATNFYDAKPHYGDNLLLDPD
jgi:hypothetical protein